MRVPPRVFARPDDVGDAAAQLILARLASGPAGRPFLLGCPSGRSARSTYRHLARRAAAERRDLSRLVVVMMDEYLVADSTGQLVVVDPGEPHSCAGFGTVEIAGRVNRALVEAGVPHSHQIRPENLWLPDPHQPEAYEHLLAESGGVDLFLLACGAGDGHVAFNAPGADAESRTRVVSLPESTRRDNLATFPSFDGDLEDVPKHGVTVGIATIREASAEVVMLVHGADKQLASRRLLDAERYQADWPATVLADCRSPHLFLDRAAYPASALTTTIE